MTSLSNTKQKRLEESFFLAFNSLYPLLSFALSSLLRIRIRGSLSLFSRFQMMLCTLLRIATFSQSLLSLVLLTTSRHQVRSCRCYGSHVASVVEYRQRESIACFRSTFSSSLSRFHLSLHFFSMSLLRRALRTVGLRFGKDRYLAGTDLEGESFKLNLMRSLFAHLCSCTVSDSQAIHSLKDHIQIPNSKVRFLVLVAEICLIKIGKFQKVFSNR